MWSSRSSHVLDMNARWQCNHNQPEKDFTRVVIPPLSGGGGALPTATEGFLTCGHPALPVFGTGMLVGQDPALATQRARI